MAVLTNITVGTDQLEIFKPDIENYLFEGQTDFSDQITAAKEEVYSEIKLQEQGNYPTSTDAQLVTILANIKDYSDTKPLQRYVSLISVALIMAGNGLLDESNYFRDMASRLRLQYYIDSDEDGVADSSENSIVNQAPFFGR